MKNKIMLFTISILVFFTSCSKAQTEEQTQAIFATLENVKEGKVLKEEKSWLISTSKDTVALSAIQKDKWVLIDFWSTGCKPCIEEFPNVEKFRSVYQDKIEVIAVSVDKNFKKFKKSNKKYKIGIPSYFGGFTYKNPVFNLNIETFKDEKKGVIRFRTKTPQYVLINPNGLIIDKQLPKPSDSEFKKKIDAYLLQK